MGPRVLHDPLVPSRGGVHRCHRRDDLADAVNHHPDVDLRYAGVALRLNSHDVELNSHTASRTVRDLDPPNPPTTKVAAFITWDA
jgi:4a-hydroxytetrahydrobiopterin dehydratase